MRSYQQQNNSIFIKISQQESNPIPHLEYKYLPGPEFLFVLTFPNKQFFRLNSAFKSCDHIVN